MSRGNRPLKLEDIQQQPLVAGEHAFGETAAPDGEGDENTPADYKNQYVVSREPLGTTLLMAVCACGAIFILPLLSLAQPEAMYLLLMTTWLLSWIIGLPTFVYAVYELRAIYVGAVDSSQKLRTQVAAWGSLAEVIVSAGLFFGYTFSFDF